MNSHVVEVGSPNAPAVVLLHGFPEFWFGWRHQIAPLADAGFRVLVPDQRGYGLSIRRSSMPPGSSLHGRTSGIKKLSASVLLPWHCFTGTPAGCFKIFLRCFSSRYLLSRYAHD